MKRPREWLIRFSLVLASIGLLEGAARLLYHPSGHTGGEWYFEFDGNKNYRWKANLEGVFGTQKFRTNSEHRVGRELPVEKPSGTRRLAVLGDSVSFGFNVAYEKTYVPLLEQALGAETLNYGVPGYSTFQEYFDLLDSRQYCPDLVLLQFSFNDLVEPFLFLRRLGGLGIDYHRVPDVSSLHFRLRSFSRLYELVSDLLVRSAVREYGKNEMRIVMEKNQELSERMLVENPDSEKGAAAWAEFHYWLHRIAEKCDGRCVFLLSPHSLRYYFAGARQETTILELRRRVEAEGFAFLDPLPAMAAEIAKSRNPEPTQRWNQLFLDDIHPNERGHALLAGYLTEKLRAMLKQPPRVCGVK